MAQPRKRSQRDDGWEDLFWTVFSLSTNPIALVDPDRQYVEVNEALCQLLGASRRGALVGRRMDEFLVAGEQAAVESRWHELWAASEDWVEDRRMVRADGVVLPVHYAGHICLLEGRRLAILVVLSAPQQTAPAAVATSAQLTPREREVLYLVALGCNAPEIAHRLVISHETVRTHVRNAMRKTGARTRAQLVAIALGEGHVVAPDPSPPDRRRRLAA